MVQVQASDPNRTDAMAPAEVLDEAAAANKKMLAKKKKAAKKGGEAASVEAGAETGVQVGVEASSGNIEEDELMAELRLTAGSGGVGQAVGAPTLGGGGSQPGKSGSSTEETAKLTPEQVAKHLKRKAYRERKKLKKQAGIWTKAKENPNVYVSGLPEDFTEEELRELFKKAGVLKVDSETGQAKVKIYRDDQEKCKGDALVSYMKVESVAIAIKFMHEAEVRPGCKICVQAAQFDDDKVTEVSKHLDRKTLEEMAQANAAAGMKQQKERARAAKAERAQLTDWTTEEMDDGSGRRIVMLKHMFSRQEAEDEDDAFYTELAEEVKTECQVLGTVEKVTPIQRHPDGVVCVKFKYPADAETCLKVLDGRFFAGRTISAIFYDKKVDLKARCLPAKSSTPAAGPSQAQERTEQLDAEADRKRKWQQSVDEQSSDEDVAPVPTEGPSLPVPRKEEPPAKGMPAQEQTWEEYLENESSDSDIEPVPTE